MDEDTRYLDYCFAGVVLIVITIFGMVFIGLWFIYLSVWYLALLGVEMFYHYYIKPRREERAGN